MVKTDHILFIASGAFHLAKPSDLIPELQGRFPIRVELGSLTRRRLRGDPDRDPRQPDQAVPGAAGDRRRDARASRPTAIRRLAQIAFDVNERTENIGARRLSTVMERLLDEVSFDAPNRDGQTVRDRRRCRRRQARRAGAERGPVALHPVSAQRARDAGRASRASVSRRDARCERQSATSDCSCSRPSKISVSTVSNFEVEDRRQLDRRAAGHQQHRLLAAVLASSLRCIRSTAPAIASAPPLISASLVLVGKSTTSPVGTCRPGGAHLERAQHHAEARQDQAAEEPAVGIERIDRHRGADHHDQHRPRRAVRQHAMRGRRSARPSGRRRAASGARSRW